MAINKTSRLGDILNEHEQTILHDWIRLQAGAGTRSLDLIGDDELHRQSKDFLTALRQGVQSGKIDNIEAPAWENARELLANISRSRARMGFTPSETAIFVFSLKQPLFQALGGQAKPRNSGPLPRCWTNSACTPPSCTRRAARKSSRSSSARCWSFPPR